MTVPNPPHVYPKFPDARLPIYPSVAALIHAITDDARQIAARDPYTPDSNHWHGPIHQGPGCAVCTALANFHRAVFHELDRPHIAPSQERLFTRAHMLFHVRLTDCEAFHDTQSFDRHLDVLDELAAWLDDQPALHHQETAS